jgi:hypothetical protein
VTGEVEGRRVVAPDTPRCLGPGEVAVEPGETRSLDAVFDEAGSARPLETYSIVMAVVVAFRLNGPTVVAWPANSTHGRQALRTTTSASLGGVVSDDYLCGKRAID